ncbi:MAG TPA: PrsW family glutamic-type intramembrane protease [Anaerolineales bacterium]|nr:PrsW family glutamic-type intramembrane protease [Anaerolineales bacterium]
MTGQVCCVDHTRPGTKVIAGRWFCDEHYAKAAYKRGGVWRSEIAGVVGLLVFVGALVGVDAALQPNLGGSALLLVGVVMALVPAALWLFFFYQQDRLEPEPVHNVARMFLIGLALAGALGIPFTDQFFKVSDWLYRDTLTTVLGSIFLPGAVEAFVVYATLRYFIFDSPEFDERTDGVIYGTAAALGYATALNLQFILSSGGAALGAGEIFVTEVALARAAFGGLLGYFVGRSKLEQEPVWWLPVGLLLTAVLNGLFNYVRGIADPGEVMIGTETGLPSFTGLLLAGGLAIVVAVVVYYLINRDIARSLGGDQPAATIDPTVGDRRANYAAVGTLVAMLIVGALAWNNAVNRTAPFDQGGVRGAYPAYFGDATDEGEVLRVVDNVGTGAEFAILTRDLSGSEDAESVADALGGQRGTDFQAYKVVSRGASVVNGKPAFVQRFAYVDPLSLVGAVPEVREGADYIFTNGSRAIVVTLLTSPDDVEEVEPLFARFLNSLLFQ